MDVGQGDTDPDVDPQEGFPDLTRIMTDAGMTNQGILLREI